ncbi:MAG: 30S ribosomal protein S8 [Flavobacteriales bacterium]|nr:30S ribosomal protein S8 [Flavobacteriales bacterium]
MTTHPIADYLTCLRNATLAHKKVVERFPPAAFEKDITRILYDNKGYILNYKTEEDGKCRALSRSRCQSGCPAPVAVPSRSSGVSTPGLRQYTDASRLPRRPNGLGVAIIKAPAANITDS